MAEVMGQQELSPLVISASKKYGIPAGLISAVIQRESSGRPRAESGTGPVGLMQVSKTLAKQYGYDPKDRYDPAKNIDMGARYLKDNLKAFNGDVRKAMVGYSEGTAGARQMFAGKRGFTPQALSSMNHKLFTPYFNSEEQAESIANPMGVLKDAKIKDTFDSQNLQKANAAQAPTQADVMASQAGALSGNPQAPVQVGQNQEEGQNWTDAALAAAAMLAGKQPNSRTVEQVSTPGRAASQYSPQTQAVLRMLSGIGTNIYNQ